MVYQVLGLYASAQEQGHLSAQLAENLPLVLGDSSQLRQVIHNLVQNALDAVADRPDGRVQISTEVAGDPSGDQRAVRLKVSDNGAGFADKVLHRAFEPYVTTKARGTGLGLAVVKKIADEHGARVRIVNRTADAREGGVVVGAQVSLSFSRFASPPSAPPSGHAAPGVPPDTHPEQPAVAEHRA